MTPRFPNPGDTSSGRGLHGTAPEGGDEGAGIARVPLQVTHNCLIASIQVDLDEGVLSRFQRDLLERVRTTGARTVLLDLGGLGVLDAEEFVALRRVAEMARWMGARPVFVGLRPGIASSLVDLDVDVAGLETAPSLERALELAAEPAPTTPPASSTLFPLDGPRAGGTPNGVVR